MKKTLFFLIFIFFIALVPKAQQNFSLNKYFAETSATTEKVDGEDKKIVEPVKVNRFGIIGIGNLNTESFQGINSAGKFSAYVRPLLFGMNDITLGISFNKNATNNDSLLASTILFPDLGNSSFTGSIESSLFIGPKKTGDEAHYLSPFFEFAHKNVKSEKDKTEYYFSLLHYTIGCKYIFRYHFEENEKDENIALSIAPYLSIYNIPDEDNNDYWVLMGSDKLPSNFNAVGIKISFQYKGFQVFADFRHVPADEEKIPLRSIRGFNSNIGFVFTTDIIER